MSTTARARLISAFSGCTSLASIEIPASVTSIGAETFYDCTSLASITIPAGVTSIGEAAFYNCGALKTVYYGDTQEKWSAITIGSKNACLLNAEIVFAS